MASIPLSEVQKAVDAAFKIPGLYRRGEAAFLYRLARRKGTVVEIGCWQGRTTSLLVQASRVWGADVVTVDPFTPMPVPHKQSSPEIWRGNLRKLGLTPPPLLQQPAHEAAAQVSGPLGMVFIDGNHEQTAVMQDLRDWTPKLAVGGIVALHDMFYPTIPGVARAVAEWWTGDGLNRWKLMGLQDFTIAFQRMH